MVTKYHLSVTDYIAIAITLLIAAGIGIWFRLTGNRQKTVQEYLLAGKDMPKVPVILSTTVTLLSTTTMIAAPAEVYRFGITITFMYIFGSVGVVIAAYVFIPVYFQCGVSTVYEFLEIRYGKSVRYAVSALFVIQMVFYMSVSLYGPVLALGAVADLSLEMSIIIIGLICTFYCMMGGLKAVLWTDVFQAILIVTFVIILYSKGIVEAGGVGEIFRKSLDSQRLYFWNFSPDLTLRYTFLSTFARGVVGAMSYYGASQVEVQRTLSLRNLERARSASEMYRFLRCRTQWRMTLVLSCLCTRPGKAYFKKWKHGGKWMRNISLVWSSITTVIINSMCCLSGLIMYGIFHSCDPIKDALHTGIKKYDQVIPYYIVTRFSSVPGLTGLCMAGIFSGSLSSISSALNSVSTVTVIDFIKPLLSEKASEKRIVLIAKLLSLVYGLICIGLTFCILKVDSIIATITIVLGALEGPVLAIFLIAVLTRKGTESCALFGLLLGVALMCWIGYGSLFSGYVNPTLALSTSGCPSQMNFLDVLQNSTSPCSRNATFVPKQSFSEPFILYRISFTWISTIGCCVSLIFTFLAILITGWKNTIPVDSKCLSPVARLWFKRDSSYKSNGEHADVIPLEKMS